MKTYNVSEILEKNVFLEDYINIAGMPRGLIYWDAGNHIEYVFQLFDSNDSTKSIKVTGPWNKDTPKSISMEGLSVIKSYSDLGNELIISGEVKNWHLSNKDSVTLYSLIKPDIRNL